MTLPTITPEQAKAMLADGATLIDIRNPDEHACARIAGARNMPVDSLQPLPATDAKAVIFHCKTGMRTAANAQKLASAAPCTAYLLEGGLEGWRKAGLPVIEDKRQPMEIMRQVQITAGALVLAGVVLGQWVAPGFYGLSAFVGVGLVFAGVSGWCGMAKCLAAMPWNRAPV